LRVISNSAMGRLIKLKIAGLVMEARCDAPGLEMTVSDSKRPFLTQDGEPDCMLNVHFGPLPEITLDQKVFDSVEGPWRLFRSGEKTVVQMVGMVKGKEHVHRVAVFDPDFRLGDLYILPDAGRETQDPLRPFLYPLDILLVNNLLALDRGINLHASGVVSDRQGLVFCGTSGAGKSTVAGLWKERQADILSDERVAVRARDEEVRVYGTPWQSSARLFCANEAPLKVIYFLKQAQENHIVPVTALEAATRLFVCCYAPTCIRQGLEGTLAFIDEMVKRIPCFELRFTPDQRAIDEVLKHVENI
jgi:hypothetical protein